MKRPHLTPPVRQPWKPTSLTRRPEAANAATIGEMPAYRFKAKARTWRERHHAESIEKRHAKGVADRRVEYRPDQDGMAWLSAYLPADQASAIWNKLTTAARELQGPEETRTLTQLRTDLYGRLAPGRHRQPRNHPFRNRAHYGCRN
jgi:hypothetical protein